jgi:hypothetical protein
MKQIMDLIRVYGLPLLAAVIVVTPAVWKIAELHFGEHLNTQAAQVALLREKVAVLMEQKTTLEEKLRQPSALTDVSDTDVNELSPSSRVRTSIIAGSRLPNLMDDSKPTKHEIRDLAIFYGLFNRWKVNPQLRFKEGDIVYWSEQGLTEEELKKEFKSRQTVLFRAEKSRESIPTQSDLSYKAEQLQEITQ